MNDKTAPRPAHPARSRLAVLATLGALLLTALTPGMAAAADDGGYWGTSTYSSKDEQQLVTLTNQARAAAGLNSLVVDSALTSMARWRSKDMSDRGYFSHYIPPDNKLVFDYLSASGYCYTVAGENIGMNNLGDADATASIQQGFMNSATHKANILGKWTVIGVGAWEGPDNMHYWTVLFAIKCGTSPAPAPTPKPVVTPKPAPAATPKPAATPRPTARPTASSTPTPTPDPTPVVTLPPLFHPQLDPSDDPGGPERTFVPATQSAEPQVGADLGLQLVDPPVERGLVDAIVGDVTAPFFGH